MSKEITCPECGCVIHLEWKSKKEIEENLNKLTKEEYLESEEKAR